MANRRITGIRFADGAQNDIDTSTLNIGYFLEDVAHENFVKTLVTRVALEMGFSSEDLNHDVRNAIGGKGRATRELRQFLRDVKSGGELPFTILVVAIDGNCQRDREKRDEIAKIVQQTNYPGTPVCVVPDPHIERWYLIDQNAFCKAIEIDFRPEIPSYKCEWGRYKRAMQEAFSKADLAPPLGGAEYGEDIALKIVFYTVQREDAAFKHFISELRAALQPFIR